MRNPHEQGGKQRMRRDILGRRRHSDRPSPARTAVTSLEASEIAMARDGVLCLVFCCTRSARVSVVCHVCVRARARIARAYKCACALRCALALRVEACSLPFRWRLFPLSLLFSPFLALSSSLCALSWRLDLGSVCARHQQSKGGREREGKRWMLREG